jgi:hypothetical protein
MTYVASPRTPENSEARASNLAECLTTARKHLDETSSASKTEKDEILIAGAVEACWNEEEVRAYFSKAGRDNDEPEAAALQPTIGLVPTLNS